MDKYLVRQDGAQFYLYSPNGDLEAVMTAPYRVRDFDMRRAEQARLWFKLLMEQWNVAFYFEGEEE